MLFTKIVSVVDWCETWSHKLREDHRLRVLENVVSGEILHLEGDGANPNESKFYSDRN
jgi:hypothetical protein